ncbi:MAG: HNH endonuclease [Nitrosopumilus sp. H8]|nr:MAG: HNH endonuclease [Nitrosopumilus sp. H8]
MAPSMPNKIPYDLIPAALISVLSQNGSTIQELENKGGRKYNGDASQQEYKDRPVWHKKKYLDEAVAIRLKLHPSIWGPKRTTSDFHIATSQIISKLRNGGNIADWNSSRRLGIWRLVKIPDIKTKNLDMSIAQRATQTAEPPAMPPSEEKMKQIFVSILTKGRKDNTYKFALARAILDYCNGSHESGYDIPYQYLSKKFLEYYWHQECKFRIKQDFHANADPMAIQAIRKVFGDDVPGSFDLLDPADIRDAEKKILSGVFGHARNKTSLVVPKFQKIMEGNRAVEKRVFYTYDDDAKIVRLRPEAFEFFRNNYRILSMAVLSEWAKFLERVNESLPRLVAKIEQDNKMRGSLTDIRRTYLKHTGHCFYCQNRLERGYIHVDHLIPWSYLFDDSAWNLVLACRGCNLRKSGSLPQEEFRKTLIQRNTQYYDSIGILRTSLDRLNIGRGWESEIKNHYKNCMEYGFGIRKMP